MTTSQNSRTDVGRPTCTWCRRGTGHVEADHPLPKTHPDYDAFYDAGDAELAVRVSETPRRAGGS